jgi:L-ribulose-5-phosphate 3-epimerase
LLKIITAHEVSSCEILQIAYTSSHIPKKDKNAGFFISLLVIPRLKMVAAKDFIWEKNGPHRWRPETCPLGQGMSDWREFLHTLSQSDFHGPISYQHEYTISGVSDSQGIALSRKDVPQVMSAIRQNLDYLKSLIREAYGEA